MNTDGIQIPPPITTSAKISPSTSWKNSFEKLPSLNETYYDCVDIIISEVEFLSMVFFLE